MEDYQCQNSLKWAKVVRSCTPWQKNARLRENAKVVLHNIAVFWGGLYNSYWLLSVYVIVKSQWGVVGVQRSDGLHHGGSAHVELRSGWNDLYPLERSATTPAGISDNDQRPDGSCIHQVPTWLDHVGRACHHFYLGSASESLYCFSDCCSITISCSICICISVFVLTKMNLYRMRVDSVCPSSLLLAYSPGVSPAYPPNGKQQP